MISSGWLAGWLEERLFAVAAAWLLVLRSENYNEDDDKLLLAISCRPSVGVLHPQWRCSRRLWNFQLEGYGLHQLSWHHRQSKIGT